ncbi:MAG: prepilin-type N-terminal cleavage/methylation domain-containing protein [Candidatus Omnitrophica bacterium]|nr:prepilin-type N-terminal cleavage/methylation domain-containing protein [Candidatus Omnitrophota bacterium]MBU2044226.1 prepilin-type N-terminal cleavage/methylation domain-containing protein [Candidatus Omnitrophota bacterium]MBU2250850.1 prepilin-type N-terminal cleavage/methylation domain-containing protein [Candidatus Omnitrophota bacterium]MBU2265455.1 prepilin-type N-terminal cleavage/methylation domain-containing protein [Candidatus Omnitrophota bacterium]MBU2473457.1 prepilin-type N-
MIKSFTLIELIVVIAIIAILAAIIAPNAFKAIEKAKVAEVIANFKTLKTAVGAVYADTGRKVMDNCRWGTMHLFPGQTPLDTDPFEIDRTEWTKEEWPGWDGPYVEKINGIHPWGGTYAFSRWQDFSFPPNGIMELVLEIDDCRYPCPDISYNGQRPMPRNAAEIMDAMIDDAEDWPFNTGGFRGNSDYHWIMFWDYEFWP